MSRFSQAIRRTFFHPEGGKSAGARLLTLNQRTRSAIEYSIDFQTLAAECSWGKDAFMEVYYKGLSERVKDELATRDLPTSLDALYDLATRVDNRLREWARERGGPPHHFRARNLLRIEGSKTPSSEPEPTQIGVTRKVLRGQVRGEGQLKLTRRSHPWGLGMPETDSRDVSLYLSAALTWEGGQTHAKVCIDSGAVSCFMDSEWVCHLKISNAALDHPIKVWAVDGRQVTGSPIVTQMQPLTLRLGDHEERIAFLVTCTPHTQIVLGYSWLAQHNPQIDWASQ